MDQFLSACGASGPLSLRIDSPDKPGGEVRAFDLPFVIVGSDPRSDLRLSDPEVSERHAYFQLIDGQLLCADLGSRIGVYQGGKCRRLSTMDRDQPVRIGPYRVRLLAGDSAPAADLDELPPVHLELTHRSVRKTRCEVPGGLVLVGSGADCRVRLVDPSVSTYHCSLVRTPEGLWVVDLLGQGGVRINGQEVSYARIHEGDAIAIGHSEIRLEPAEVTTSAPVPVPRFESEPVAIAIPASMPMSDVLPITQAAELVERVLAPMVNQVGRMQQQMVDEFHQARTAMFETFSTLHQEQTSFLNEELEKLHQLGQDLQALRADLERQTRQLADRQTETPPPPLPALPAATTQARATPRPSTFAVKNERSLVAHNEQAHVLLCERITSIKEEHKSRWQRILAMIPGALQGKTTL